ncbi:hypothetical protein Tco_1109929 [Tanacetum coccineum]|uniref:Reverse transcriptase domain-containing protein n=1 Tax=Tanacetum coccineum TaxID=301880 RepID=A0ABQ5IHD0_9ASTR
MTPKEILATEGASFPKPPPMRTPEEQRVGNGYCEYHRQKGHTTNECVQLRQLIDKLVKEGKIDHPGKEHQEGKDKQEERKQERRTRRQVLTPSIGATSQLPDEFYGDNNHHLPYNGIIGRPGISAMSATQRQHATKVTNLKVAIHPDYPEQEVSIGGSLSDTGRAAVCALLQRNLDIFAWEPKHMTGVPRSITEHKLKIRQGYSPVRQKKRGQAPERAKAILEEVHKLVEAGIMREVYYHDWLSNPVMVKITLSDGRRRMCVDSLTLTKQPQDC